ncbi:MAG: hypothetical protein IPP82_15775 [Xanthomonadales bacterium]|nr:hypothetical protein [Xanthomonadales bacterium]
MPRLLASTIIVVLVCLSARAHAEEPQSLGATVNGTRFAGDDDTILFVPLDSGAFSLGAASAGAASYPPPKTPIDRLSIVCSGFAPGKPLRLGKNEFSKATCNATFTLGANDKSFTLDKDNTANRFEISASHAKVIEGSFELHLTSKGGEAMIVSDGHFVAEDRQM